MCKNLFHCKNLSSNLQFLYRGICFSKVECIFPKQTVWNLISAILTADSNIEKETLQKWKKTFSTVFRKRVARQYTHFLGRDIVETMGYNFDRILNEVEEIQPSWGNPLVDFYQQERCGTLCFFEKFIFRDKLKKYLKSREYSNKFFPHS